MSNSIQAANKKYYINSIIGLVIMFGVGYLPPFGGITELGMKYVAVFLGLIWLWSLCDMGWPTLAAFVALLTTGALTLNGIYAAAFSNATVMSCLFLMLVVLCLGECGLFDYVAVWLLKLSIFKGHPWRLTFAILLVGYIGTCLQGGLVVLFMLYDIIYKICDNMGLPRTHPWVAACIFGCGIMMICGSSFLPFLPMVLFVFGLFTSIMSEIPFVTFIILSVFYSFLVLGIYFLIIKFVMRIDLSAMADADASKFVKQLDPMTSYQKKMTYTLIAYVVLLILIGSASLLPKNLITSFFSRIGTVGMSWAFMCLLCIWRSQENGRSAFPLGKMGGIVQWESVFIVMIGMTIGPIMIKPDLGISTFLLNIFKPIFGSLSGTTFILVVCLITLFLTNIFNNTVILMLIANICIVMSSAIDFNPTTLAFMMLFAPQIALFLPGASYFASLAHGQSEHCGKKNCYIYGLISMISTALSFFIIIPLCNMFF